MTMPLVSVSISYGSRILRPFAIVQTEDNITLRELYTAICSGKLGDDEMVVDIPGGSASPVKAMVGKDPTGFFQNVPLNVKVSDCCVFGIFFKFCVQPPAKVDEQMQTNRVNASNAFDVLMQAAKDKRVPEKRDTSGMKNAKFDLYNVIIQHIRDSGLGWRSESLDVGEHFVQILCDSLWYLDPHRPKLHQQQCALPTRFDIFIGFNNPAKHKHVPIHLKSDELLTLSQQVYGILEQVGGLSLS